MSENERRTEKTKKKHTKTYLAQYDTSLTGLLMYNTCLIVFFFDSESSFDGWVVRGIEG